jgi:hypothetical protein
MDQDLYLNYFFRIDSNLSFKVTNIIPYKSINIKEILFV